MNYEQIRYSSPDGLTRKKTYQKPAFSMAIILFVIQMFLFLTVEGWCQYLFGMGGLAITEGMILGLTVLFVFLTRSDPAEIFPFRRPDGTAVAGTYIMFAGTYGIVLLSNLVLYYLIPEELTWFSDQMESTMDSPLLLEILVVCLLPAICEEAMHRGFIQHALPDRMKNIYAQCAVMGVFFALFHFYPIRYPSMFIMGFFLSYLCAKTGSMFYSCLIHFSLNTFSTILDRVTGGAVMRLSVTGLPAASLFTRGAASSAEMPGFSLAMLGVEIMFLGIPAVFLLYLGNFLIDRGIAPVVPDFLPSDPAGRKHVLWQKILFPIIGLAVIGFFCIAISLIWNI
ncbi:MAG: CPBP family intramembrane glutamic endopeptidase [Bilifractor sp.]|jgi:membrane protease YdiL (CAAX protease family)